MEDNKDNKEPKKRKKATIEIFESAKMNRLIFLTLIAILALFLFFSVRSTIDRIFISFLPLFLAIAAGWAVNPVITFFSKKLGLKKGFWKAIFLTFFFIIIFGIIAAAVYYLVYELANMYGPFFGRQNAIEQLIKFLQNNSTSSLSYISNNVLHLNNGKSFNMGSCGAIIQITMYIAVLFKNSIQLTHLTDFIQNISTDTSATHLVTIFFKTLPGIITILTVFFFTVFFSFFIVGKYESLTGWIKTSLPIEDEDKKEKVSEAFRHSLFAWLKAVTTNVFILIIICTVFLIIAGFAGNSIYYRHGFLFFALFFGFMAFIPIVGVWIGSIPIAIAGILTLTSTGNWHPLVIALSGCIVAILVEHLISTKFIYSKRTKLHPITIIINITLFFAVFGVVGAFIATPILTTVKAIMNDVYGKKWKI